MTSNGPPVHVLLGTYNGERYLRPLIESIRAQTLNDWTLLVRDDGSSDGTVRVLEDLAGSDDRLQLLRTDPVNLGCVGNFSRLAQLALEQHARYVMFADQDDVWHPTKIARTLDYMQAMERRRGPAAPLVVHTDLEVIDQQGVNLHRSFMRLQRIHHEAERALKTLLVQNFVTGCTAMVNAPLLALGTPVPSDALMHDWWFALCAAACGSVEFLPEQTMAYRRHGSNTVTVRGYWRTMNPLKTNWARLWSSGKRDHVRALQQAQALSRRLIERGCGSDSARRLVDDFVDLHSGSINGVSRVGRALALGVRSQTLARTTALYLRILTWSGAERVSTVRA